MGRPIFRAFKQHQQILHSRVLGVYLTEQPSFDWGDYQQIKDKQTDLLFLYVSRQIELPDDQVSEAFLNFHSMRRSSDKIKPADHFGLFLQEH